jgi:hypothetical protein
MTDIAEELIRQRSYEIWLRDGCPQGRDVQHWLEAKAELEAELRAAHFPSPYCDCRTTVLPRPTISKLPHKRLSSRLVGRSGPSVAKG